MTGPYWPTLKITVRGGPRLSVWMCVARMRNKLTVRVRASNWGYLWVIWAQTCFLHPLHSHKENVGKIGKYQSLHCHHVSTSWGYFTWVIPGSFLTYIDINASSKYMLKLITTTSEFMQVGLLFSNVVFFFFFFFCPPIPHGTRFITCIELVMFSP